MPSMQDTHKKNIQVNPCNLHNYKKASFAYRPLILFRYGKVVNSKLQVIEEVKARIVQNHRRLKEAIKNVITQTKKLCEDLQKQDDVGAAQELKDLTTLRKRLKRNISEDEFEAIQVQINIGLFL